MDNMYANQITLTVGNEDAILHFAQAVPTYNEKGEVVGTSISAETNVILSLSGLKSLSDLMNKMLTGEQK